MEKEKLEGSSIDKNIFKDVKKIAQGKKKILVILDSNHTHKHVLKELEMYQSFVSDKSYLVVFDTIIEFMRPNMFQNRPWGIGDNPMTAVQEFLKVNKDFRIDKAIHEKLQISVAPNGYLKCSRN